MLSLSFYRRLDRWLSKIGIKGHEIDLAKATEAANNGDPQGLSDLGDLYSRGEGVPRNYTKAIELYTRAAELGRRDCQYALGLEYQRGEMVSQNYVRAYAWFNVAALSGDKFAVEKRDELEDQMDTEQVIEAQHLSDDLLEKIRRTTEP